MTLLSCTMRDCTGCIPAQVLASAPSLTACKHMQYVRRYGVKLDAAALLQDWVRDIGSKAGLGLENTNILSGAVGVPESRLEARTLPISIAVSGLKLAPFW